MAENTSSITAASSGSASSPFVSDSLRLSTTSQLPCPRRHPARSVSASGLPLRIVVPGGPVDILPITYRGRSTYEPIVRFSKGGIRRDVPPLLPTVLPVAHGRRDNQNQHEGHATAKSSYEAAKAVWR